MIKKLKFLALLYDLGESILQADDVKIISAEFDQTFGMPELQKLPSGMTTMRPSRPETKIEIKITLNKPVRINENANI